SNQYQTLELIHETPAIGKRIDKLCELKCLEDLVHFRISPTKSFVRNFQNLPWFGDHVTNHFKVIPNVGITL
ncbi:hypothetical protein, partial [Modestobacter italicus]|uniref:hypothetical protein n=1 Tax=Modestobacter italicus (strain DSM 44449 / CECT 9708 / BC 501) TaxID=2732864 RepID=UPI001C95492B